MVVHHGGQEQVQSQLERTGGAAGATERGGADGGQAEAGDLHVLVEESTRASRALHQQWKVPIQEEKEGSRSKEPHGRFQRYQTIPGGVL